MQASEQVASDQQIARPLQLLARLIRNDLEKGKEAAERAGLPHYRSAGALMIEARSQLKHGEFGPWITRNFKVSRTQAYRYMALAEASGAQMFPAGNFSSMRDFRRRHLGEDTAGCKARPEWTEQARRRLEDAASRTQDRQIQFKLANEIINTGYRALAARHHPDTGGSKEAMAQLNAARDHLKKFA